jgi:hypothetical protein
LVFLLQLYTPVEYSVFDTFSKITGLNNNRKNSIPLRHFSPTFRSRLIKLDDRVVFIR